jgi:serine/threonine protein kinase
MCSTPHTYHPITTPGGGTSSTAHPHPLCRFLSQRFKRGCLLLFVLVGCSGPSGGVEQAFELLELLGQGTFGRVYRAVHKALRSPAPCALRRSLRRSSAHFSRTALVCVAMVCCAQVSGFELAIKIAAIDDSRLAEMKREVQILKQCRHPNSECAQRRRARGGTRAALEYRGGSLSMCCGVRWCALSPVLSLASPHSRRMYVLCLHSEQNSSFFRVVTSPFSPSALVRCVQITAVLVPTRSIGCGCSWATARAAVWWIACTTAITRRCSSPNR